MRGKGADLKSFFMRFLNILVAVVSLCTAMPIEALAAETEEHLEYQQIDAFVDEVSSEKVALDGLMPVNADVTAEPAAATEDAALCTYDITILHNGEEYQPDEEHPIKVEISNALIKTAVAAEHELQLWHILDDGSREQIENFSVAGDTITFEAFGFSVYEISEYPVCTFNFYYPDANGYSYYYYPLESGSKDYRQILKDGEKLIIPQLPSSSDKSTFIGWFVGNDKGPTEKTSFDFSEAVTVKENTSVNLYAVFADCAYLIFHDQYDAEKDAWPVVATRRGEMKDGSVEIRTDDITVTYDGGIGASEADKEKAAHMIFLGWSFTQVENAGVNGDAELVPETLTISENKDLYPIFSEIRWLSFNTMGGNYIAPEYHDIGSKVTKLPTPTRKGYTFDGWYTDPAYKNGTKVTSLTISEDTTLYAKWKEADTNYTIVIWRQKDEYDPDNDYDYAESISVSARTGSTITLDSKYTKLSNNTTEEDDYYGFTYKKLADDVTTATVAGDGSTVLNVHYDRNVHTLRFDTVTYNEDYWGVNSLSNRKTVGTITGRYGSNISKYFPIVGTNGKKYEGYYWYDDGNFKELPGCASTARTYSELLSTLETMPDHDVIFDADGSGTSETIYYYIEIGDESDSLGTTRTFVDASGTEKLYTLYKTVKHNYNFITYDEEYHPIDGYVRDKRNAEPYFGENGWCYNSNGQQARLQNENSAPIGGRTNDRSTETNVNYLYYNRNQYTLEFYDPMNHKTISKEEDVYFNDKLVNHLIPDPTPPEGYQFTGWYYDSICKVPVDFTDLRMPSKSQIFYAGWEKVTHLVELDPNGGELQKDQATWYLVEHGGAPIEEYTNATRNYIASQEGDFYYHYAGYPTEPDAEKGAAYYSTSISGADLSVSYAYEPNSYRYAQWYEVHEDGSETVYKFGEPVMHDTKLRLHWKELTTYHVKYDAGKGTLDTGNKSEQDFQTLDGSEYADHASAVITRSANAPANQNFVGWKIRGDKSGKVYVPGQSFEFTSQFSEIETDANGKKTRLITLDAVYQNFDTAKIIYDANGGTIAADANLGEALLKTKDMEPTYTNDGSTASIGNLLNNSGIKLSDGTGFTYKDYEFIGWSTQKDGSETFFSKNSIVSDSNFKVNVDTDEPTTLYAVWQVKVYFDKNNDKCTWDATAWNADTTNGKYKYDSDKKQYYTLVNLNSVLEEPEATSSMKSNDKDEIFWFWSTKRYQKGSKDAIAYDFSKPVTGEMTLYGYWDKLEVPIHVVDSSEETLKNVDSWLKKDTSGNPINTIQIKNDTNIPFDTGGNTAKTYVDVPTGYKYAFLCAAKDINSVSDAKIIKEISYNPDERCVWLTYENDTENKPEKMPDDCELYFVYYKSPEKLNIGYVELDNSGKLSKVTVSNDAPKKTDSDPYNMGTLKPRSYLSDSDKKNYPYYSFAIGDPGNTAEENTPDASGLHIITSVSDTDYGNNRPTLQFRKTWRGYQYTTDGSTWINCGYNIKPYVVYYPSKPVIVTLDEKTIGLAKDMDEEFEYTVKISSVQSETTIRKYYSRSGYFGYTYNYQSGLDKKIKDSPGQPVSQPVDEFTLSDGESNSFTLFYSSTVPEPDLKKISSKTDETNLYYIDVSGTEKYQTIEIIQTAKTDFTTDNSGTGANHTSNLIYTYTAASNSTDQKVTFTNTRKPEVELHIALIQNGEIVQSDADHRNTANDIHIKEFGNTNSITLKDVSSGLFKGDTNDYALAGIIYGTEDDSGIVEKADDISTVSYSPADSQNTQIYDYYISSDSGKTPLGDQKIYYVYYQKPKIVYVEETSEGLKLIETITMGGKSDPVTLNGGTVSQWSYLTIPEGESLILSQSMDDYQVPPKLDGKRTNSLIYKWIGVGTGTQPTLGKVTDSSDEKYMELRIENGSVEYRFSASDDNGWKPFEGAPVVYAVYKAGNDLRITKDVVGQDTGKKYDLEIKSEKFDKDSEFDITGYSLDGTTVNTVKPDANGIISLQIEDETDIKIYGLPEGAYILHETAKDNSKFILSAEVNGVAATILDDQFTIDLKKDTEAKLKNKIPDVAPTGYREKTVPYAAMASLMLLMVLWIMKKRSVQKGVMSDGSSPI